MHYFHHVFFRTLRDAGATFLNNVYLEGDEGHNEFVCFCHRSFTTAQGLATHRRLAHGIRAIENRLIDGVTCPCCLKFLWSRQRLYQRLAYVSRKTGVNACFQQLCRRGFQADNDALVHDLCKHVKHLNRVDALQAYGPFPDEFDVGIQANEEVQKRIDELQRELLVPVVPDEASALEQCLIDKLDRITSDWFSDFQAQGFDRDLAETLPDDWLGILADFEAEFDPWLETVLLSWGETRMTDICAKFEDGEAERRLLGLTRLLAPNGRTFRDLWPLVALLGEDNVRTFFVVHLFSGRRRHGDFHERLEFWARRYNFEVTILSLDTAASTSYGNLVAEHVTWKHLVELYKAGYIAATLCGSPCETFSAARYHQPSEEDLQQRSSWPRPLRSAARFLGLDQLTKRELRQLQQGLEFFFQGIIAVALTLSSGGVLLSEHPWLPSDPALPGVWSSVWMKLLLQHPDVALHRVSQWRWGAHVRKPTGLLAVRLPQFARSLYGRQLPMPKNRQKLRLERTVQVARTGSWRFPNNVAPDTETWLSEAVQATSEVRESAIWLPDYQGQ
eukprot:s9_g70.t1